jgi:hypothetical protein
MKNTQINTMIHARSLLLCAGLLSLAGALATQAQTTQTKANNATTLTTGSSWVSGTAPGSGDIGLWNSTLSTAAYETVQLGAPMTIGEIQIVNPVGAITIWDSANALTLNGVNGVGIDMSAATQNLTISTNFLTLGGSQTWNIASGRTLTLSGTNTIANGANNLTIAGGGTLAVQYKNASSTTVNCGTGNWTINGSTLAINIQAGQTTYVNLTNFLAQATAGLTVSGNSSITLSEANSTGTHTQNFATLTMNPGSEYYNVAGRGSSSQCQLDIAALPIRNGGSMADFTGVNSSSWLAIGPSGTTLGYFTYQETGFALTKGAAASLAAIPNYLNDTWTATSNTTVTVSSAPASGSDTGTLRFGALGAFTVTLSGANTIDSGAILVNSTVTNNAATITGGTPDLRQCQLGTARMI